MFKSSSFKASGIPKITITKEKEMFTTLLTHKITNCNGQPYCHLCMSKQSNWEQALCHIEKKQHKDLETNQRMGFIRELEICTEEECRMLVENSVVICKMTYMTCIPCQCNVNRNVVMEHIYGEQHSNALKARGMQECADVREEEKHVVYVRPIVVTDRNITSDLFMECGEQTKTAVQSQERDVEECHQCNLKNENLNNNRKDNLYQSITITSGIDSFLEKECEKLVNNGIVITGPPRLVCLICECDFKALRYTIIHLNGKRHKKAIKKRDSTCKKNVISTDNGDTDQFIIKDNKMNVVDEMFDTPEITCHSQNTTNMLLEGTEMKRFEEGTLNSNDACKNSLMPTRKMHREQKEEKCLLENQAILLKNGIVRLNLKKFMCMLCKQKLYCFHDIMQHINGRRHRKVMEEQNTVQDTIENACKKDYGTINSNFRASNGEFDLLKTTHTLEETSVQLPQNRNPKRIDTYDLGSHENEKSASLSSVKKLENCSDAERWILLDNEIIILDSSVLFCSQCNQQFPSLHDTFQHINGNRHKRALNKQNAKVSNTKVKNVEYITNSKHHTATEKSDSSENLQQETNTKILNTHKLDSSRKDSNVPVTRSMELSNSSEEGLETLLLNKIKLLSPTELLCTLCNRQFPSLHNTLQHVYSKVHRNAIKEHNAKEGSTRDTDTKQPTNPKHHPATEKSDSSEIKGTCEITSETLQQETNTKILNTQKLDSSRKDSNVAVTPSMELSNCSEEGHETLLLNKIKLLSPTEFLCTLCNRQFPSHHNTLQHVYSKVHRNAMKEHNAKEGSTRDTDTKQPTNPKHHAATEKSDSSEIKGTCEITSETLQQETNTKILNTQKLDSSRKDSNVAVTPSMELSNCSEEEHETLLLNKIKLLSPTEFLCTLCNRQFPSHHNTLQHVYSKVHRNAMKEHNAKEGSTRDTDTKQPTNPKHHAATEKSDSSEVKGTCEITSETLQQETNTKILKTQKLDSSRKDSNVVVTPSMELSNCSEEGHETLLLNKIKLLSPTEFLCTLCNRQFPSHHNTLQHVYSKVHRNAMKEHNAKEGSTRDTDTKQPTNPKHHAATEKSDSSEVKGTCEITSETLQQETNTKILKTQKLDSSRKDSNVAVTPSMELSNCSEEGHETLLLNKIKLLSPTEFLCTLCNRQFPSHHNTLQHVYSKVHKNAMKEHNAKEGSTRDTDTKQPTNPKHHAATEKSDSSEIKGTCEITSETLQQETNTKILNTQKLDSSRKDSNVAVTPSMELSNCSEEGHESLLLNKIKLLSPTEFLCTLCNRQFPSHHNTLQHVYSKVHRNAMKEHNAKEGSTRDTDTKQPTNPEHHAATEKSDSSEVKGTCEITSETLQQETNTKILNTQKLDSSRKDSNVAVTPSMELSNCSEEGHETLLLNKIKLLSPTEFLCTLCNRQFPSHHNTLQHVYSKVHRNAMKEHNAKEGSTRDTDTKQPTNPKHHAATEKSDSSEVKGTCGITSETLQQETNTKILKTQKLDSSRKDSNVVVTPSMELSNCSEEGHETLLLNKIKLLSPTEFLCTLCNRQFPSHHNTLQHVYSKVHRNAMKEHNAKEGSTRDTDTKQPTNPKHHAATEKSDSSEVKGTCEITSETLQQETNTKILKTQKLDSSRKDSNVVVTPSMELSNCSEEGHETLLLNKIKLLSPTEFLCTLCNRQFPSHHNTLQHVYSKVHRNAMKEHNAKEGSTRDTDTKQLTNPKHHAATEKSDSSEVKGTCGITSEKLQQETNTKILKTQKLDSSRKDSNVAVTPSMELSNCSEEGHETLLFNKITLLSPTEFFCTLCNRQFPSLHDTLQHVYSKVHRNATKEHNAKEGSTRDTDTKQPTNPKHHAATEKSDSSEVKGTCGITSETLQQETNTKILKTQKLDSSRKDSNVVVTPSMELSNCSEEGHETLLLNKIKLLSPTEFLCTLCNRQFPSHHNTLQHVYSKVHRNAMKEHNAKEGSTRDTDTKQPTNPKHHAATEKSDSSEVKGTCEITSETLQQETNTKILKTQKLDSSRKDSNVVVTPSMELSNCSEEGHETLLLNKIKLLSPTEFLCTLCNRQFPSHHNTLQHVYSKVHRNAMKEHNAKEGSTRDTDTKQLTNPKHHAATEKSDSSEVKGTCGITSEKLQQETNTKILKTQKLDSSRKDSNVAVTPSMELSNCSEEGHETLLFNKITLLSPTEFFCTLCNRQFPSLHDTLQHVYSKVHRNATKEHNAKEGSTRDTDTKQLTYPKNDAVKEKLELSDAKHTYRALPEELQQEPGIKTSNTHKLDINQEDSNLPVTPCTKLLKFTKEGYQELLRNKIKILNSTKLLCMLCNGQFSSLLNTLKHVYGKVHRKAMTENNAITDNTKGEDAYSVTITHGTNYVMDETKHTHEDPPLKLLQETESHNDFFNTTDEYSEKECQIFKSNKILVFGPYNFVCTLCNAQCITLFDTSQHINGKKHKKAFEIQDTNLGLTESKQNTCIIQDKCEINGKGETLNTSGTGYITENVAVTLSQTNTNTNTYQQREIDNSTISDNLHDFISEDKVQERQQLNNYADNDKSTQMQFNNDFLIKTQNNTCTDIQDNAFSCDSCKLELDMNNIVQHFGQTSHRSNMLETERQDNIMLFRCFCCKLIVQGTNSLINHFLTRSHLQKLENLLHDLTLERLPGSKNTSLLCNIICGRDQCRFEEKPLIRYSIVYENSSNSIQTSIHYHCSACRADLDTCNTLTDHCVEETHMKALKKLFGCYTPAEIVTNDGNSLSTAMETMSLHEKNDSLPSIPKVESKLLSTKKKTDSHFIIPHTVSQQITQLLNVSPVLQKSKKLMEKKVAQKKENWAHSLNMKYEKKHLEIEERMYAYDRSKFLFVRANFKLYMPHSETYIYCLACNASVLNKLQSLYEHTFLDSHLSNFKKLDSDPDRYKMLLQYMKKTSEHVVQCYPCGKSVIENRIMIDTHINNEEHKIKHKEICTVVNSRFKHMQEELDSRWYSIQRFCCVLCATSFKYKMEFLLHIAKHECSNSWKDLKFDFCIPCATLWLEKEDSYSKHCNDVMHKYLLKSKDFMVKDLPKYVEELFQNVDETVEILFQLAETVSSNDTVQKEIKQSLEDSLRFQFPNLNAYLFGSRFTGLSFSDSDIDIYLDCGNSYYAGEETKKCNLDLEVIARTLGSRNQEWTVNEVLLHTKVPIIKLRHKQTDVYCDISTTHGLSVENSKLIRSYNDAYVPCRKLILFLKKWVSLCNLPGKHSIRNYALVWLVIFYLQTKSILPSVSELVKKHNKSQLICGWETGIARPTCDDSPKHTLSLLLFGFFSFYAKFNYKEYVVCPLLGRPLTKAAFVEPDELPKEMAPYIRHLTSSQKPEWFRIDAAMCVQDPLDLSHNLTKAVECITLKSFRHYCQKSVYILSNEIK